MAQSTRIRGEPNPKGSTGASSCVTPIKVNRSHVAETHTQISENSPPSQKHSSEDGLYLMGTAQSNELLMLRCPRDAV